jgi:DNA polymerase-1
LSYPDGRNEYLAFGHPTDNNVSEGAAKRAVASAYRGPVVFHNAAFDMECIRAQWGLPYPAHWYCTLIGAFLCYPHTKSLALKALAEALWDEPPLERDTLAEWLRENVPEARKGAAMAHISKAPGSLVAPYAIGDVTRTRILYRKLRPIIMERSMEGAYKRERQLLPHLITAERGGIRVDRALLGRWEEDLTCGLGDADNDIQGIVGPVESLDSGVDLADALEKAGMVAPDAWLRTPTGVRSTSMHGLAHVLPGEHELRRMLFYRAKCATLLRNHVTPWLEASAHNGRLHSRFSQTRGEAHSGARTGRISSSDPNLANVPQEQVLTLPAGYTELPRLRQALLPNEGERWVSCDYSQIELRILAHLEDDELMLAYQRDPFVDMHMFVADLIRQRLRVDVNRKMAKTISFAVIYGAGADKLAEQLGVTKGEAVMLRDAYMRSLPGVADMQNDIRLRGRYGRPVQTLGGRVYFAEKTPERDFSYKLLNYTIQGGCADLLKQAIIDYAQVAPINGGSLLCTVYDEINISLPHDSNPYLLRDVMCAAMKLDVPITADLESGPNWADLSPVEEAA